jgi:sRNA-binding carbon storage regulator CsrA
MLVLTLAVEDSAHLFLPDGRRALIKIGSVNGNKVRLCFEAPEDLKIWRESVALNSGLIRPGERHIRKPSKPYEPSVLRKRLREFQRAQARLEQAQGKHHELPQERTPEPEDDLQRNS